MTDFREKLRKAREKRRKKKTSSTDRFSRRSKSEEDALDGTYIKTPDEVPRREEKTPEKRKEKRGVGILGLRPGGPLRRRLWKKLR